MRVCAILAAVMLVPIAAAAQDPAPPASALVLERIHNDFIVAPDFKITDVDGRTGNLAGFTAGMLQGDTFFIGGAGYWLTNGSDDEFEMMYGGLMLGWNMRPERRLQFGARGLLGGGTATLATNFDVFTGGGRDRGRLDTRAAATRRTVRVGAREDFFVAEPQVTVGARLSNHFDLNFAAGYRFAGMVDQLDDRLNGPTGTISVQLRLP
jgi:hypothetical protein